MGAYIALVASNFHHYPYEVLKASQDEDLVQFFQLSFRIIFANPDIYS